VRRSQVQGPRKRGHVNQEWVSHFTHLARKWAAHEGNAFPRHGEDIMEAQDLPDDRSWIIIGFPLLWIAPESTRH